MYTFAQLKQLWINAGGNSAAAPVMAAIALAESSGNPNATNSNTNGSTDYGLWQINSVNGGSATMFSPTVNASAAVKVYNSQGANAWTTFASGAYKQFLNGASPTGVSLTGSGSTAGTATGQDVGFNPLDPFGLGGDLKNALGGIGGDIGKGISGALVSILQPFIKIAMWGMELMLGVIIVVVAAVLLIQQSSSVQEAEHKAIDLGLDAASVAEPEVAPELEAAKEVDKKQTQAKVTAKKSRGGEEMNV